MCANFIAELIIKSLRSHYEAKHNEVITWKNEKAEENAGDLIEKKQQRIFNLSDNSFFCDK